MASFTSSSTAQDEVPLSHQRKFLGLLGRYCCPNQPHLPCLSQLMLFGLVQAT